MGSYLSCLGPCFCCHRLFEFNPYRVPSVRVHGEREPICRSCVDRVNPRRVRNGLDPIVVLPRAYEPAGPEDQLTDEDWSNAVADADEYLRRTDDDQDDPSGRPG